jgi:class 3 adenylate cyclase/YHS domain-containing protein
MGDAVATEVVDRFAAMVRRAAANHDGQVVKQIGDEFMVVFAKPDEAAMFGLAVQSDAAAEDRFPDVRIGANCGALLYREGDYYGAAVNLAARVASAAGRAQFLATKAIVDKVARSDLRFVSVGPRALKGLRQHVELFEVQSSVARTVRFVDPVCGMGLASESADASLTWNGRQFEFCSEACLRRFMQQPDHYTASLA